MSFTKLYVHIVICTKRRVKVIPVDKEDIIFRYIWGIIKKCNAHLIRINAAFDHIHMLVKMPADLCVADLVREVKRASSIMIKNTLHLPGFQGWSREYAALSVSRDGLESVKQYIINQKEHHTKLSFLEEYYLMMSEEERAAFKESWFDV